MSGEIPMFHTHPALVEAIRADLHRQVSNHHGVPGDDFDGVVPRRPRHARRHPRHDER